MVGLDPFVISLVMKPCCHDSQRPFGQLLKLECGCLDSMQMEGLDPFVISLVMKPCCHDTQMPFGQLLKQCGCLDWPQMVELDPFVVITVWNPNYKSSLVINCCSRNVGV